MTGAKIDIEQFKRDVRNKKLAPVKVDPDRVLTVKDLLCDSMERALSRAKHTKCTTGVYGLDKKTGGMRPGHVWLLGADTSWGKSSFAIMLADVNMAQGKRVLIVSTEDASSLYGDRLMVRRARVDAERFRDRKLLPKEMQMVTDVAAKALPMPVFLDCIGEKVERAAKRIEKAINELDIDMVILDYLQELRAEKRTQDRRNEVADVASAVRTIIKRANKTGIILSQITVSEGKKYPDKHSIRESRDVSNGAEVILLGFTPKEQITTKSGTTIDAGQKCVLVDKAKDGTTGAVAMQWDPDSACFDEIEDPEMRRFRDNVGDINDYLPDGFEDG